MTRKNSPITLDRASRSVVVTCELCPHWAAVRLNLEEARECAANHERDHHPDLDTHGSARRMRRQYARRHAEDAPEMAADPYGTNGRY